MGKPAAHKVEKDWTVQEVLEADLEYRAANPHAPSWSTPIMQWVALHDLDAEERRFREGDQGAVLAAVAVCARVGLAMPDWLAIAFRTAYSHGIHFNAKSWDECFGPPVKKGLHLSRARKRYLNRLIVQYRVREILQTERPTPPIDDGLFERVGEELKLSKTVVAELYYEKHATATTGATTAALEGLLAPYVVDDTPLD